MEGFADRSGVLDEAAKPEKIFFRSLDWLEKSGIEYKASLIVANQSLDGKAQASVASHVERSL
jgi:hypothetical protein